MIKIKMRIRSSEKKQFLEAGVNRIVNCLENNTANGETIDEDI